LDGRRYLPLLALLFVSTALFALLLAQLLHARTPDLWIIVSGQPFARPSLWDNITSSKSESAIFSNSHFV